jgi:tryptophan-rich sensory protein
MSHAAASGLARPALGLIGAMMLGNALSNLVIFRARNLRLSGMIGDAYALLDIVLVLVVAGIDAGAAWALAPYLVYRACAVWWGHAVAELNPSS